MKTECTMRPAREDDLTAIGFIITRIWDHGIDAHLERLHGRLGEHDWSHWKVGRVLRNFKANIRNAWVTEIENRVVGFFSYAVNHQRRIGSIEDNGVLPAYRGKGIGKRQREKTLELLRAEGMRVAMVQTGKSEDFAPARHVYESADFKPFFESVIYSKKL